MAAMTPRVVVATAGHLSTTPRMLKAADALHGAGYRVRVVSANHTPWAGAADRRVMASRRWAWTVVDYSRESAAAARIATGMRFKAAHAASAALGAARVPSAVAARAYSRAHDELVRAIASEPADLIYGGTTGALAATAEAAASVGAPYAIDLEDWHSGEQTGPDAEHVHALASRIERSVIAGAGVVTASSPMISAAYAARYGVQPITIHNTFSMVPPRNDVSDHDGTLRLYWFSQTIGPGRGLEDVIAAAAQIAMPVEVHLRGRWAEGYECRLRAVQREVAPAVSLVHHDPAPPDDMVALSQPYDAGVSPEELTVENRSLCLCNKIFTYLAAGIPAILSRTPAQQALAQDLGDAAFVYDHGDPVGLADVLRALLSPGRRAAARCAARVAAERRWHWEHPLDRGALVSQIAAVVPVT
jgi:glycosyltransferase involved in cell wall biosynthesis